MRAFLINLDSNTDRLAAAKQQLGAFGIAFERFPAVNGRALSPAERSRHVARFHARMARLDKLTPGEVGCSLSHMFVFRKMIEEGIEAALIFEDDVLLSDQFPRALRKVEASLDVSKPQVFLFTEWQETDITGIGDKEFSIVPLQYALRAEAYVITLPAARAIFKVNYPIVTMNDWWMRWRQRGLIELYGVRPASSTQRQNEFKSDVTPVKPKRPTGVKRLLWKLVRMPCVAIDWLYWVILRR